MFLNNSDGCFCLFDLNATFKVVCFEKLFWVSVHVQKSVCSFNDFTDYLRSLGIFQYCVFLHWANAVIYCWTLVLILSVWFGFHKSHNLRPCEEVDFEERRGALMGRLIILYLVFLGCKRHEAILARDICYYCQLYWAYICTSVCNIWTYTKLYEHQMFALWPTTEKKSPFVEKYPQVSLLKLYMNVNRYLPCTFSLN